MEQNPELINQADAAVLRGVTRQRIEQLIKAGRLTPVKVTLFGREKLCLNKNEVLALQDGRRGRPRLTSNQLRERAARHGFLEAQEVTYHQPIRDYKVTIPAVVIKSGEKRVKIQFSDSFNRQVSAWVKPEQLAVRLAGDGREHRQEQERVRREAEMKKMEKEQEEQERIAREVVVMEEDITATEEQTTTEKQTAQEEQTAQEQTA